MASEAHELDEMTLARAQRGDQAAQRAFILLYQCRVFQLVSRILALRAGSGVADELTQEAFVRALRALPRFDVRGTARLSTWLLTIATRLALNELRRAQPSEAIAIATMSSSDRPDIAAERHALGEQVRRAIGALPVDQRTVLVLREYHELEYEEIASTLEIDLGTVKSRLSRARAALKSSLHEVAHA